MSYTVDHAKPGMIILCQPSRHESIPAHLLDWGIAGSTGGWFVHSAIVGEEGLYEQTAPAVKSPLDKYTENGWLYAVQDITATQIQHVLTWCEAHLGEHYGYEAILEDWAWYDFHLPSMLHRHPHYLTCSGWVATAYAAAGIPLTRQPLPSPMSLAFSPLLIGRRPWERKAS